MARPEPTLPPRAPPLPPASTDMAQRVHAFDWSTTPLGPLNAWPEPLRTAVGICLASTFPTFIWWDPHLINIYNDAFAPILGQRHPRALGMPAQQIWTEVWPTVATEIAAVMAGQSVSGNRARFDLQRNGYPEIAYFTYSRSPIPDGRGGVGGVFQVCSEETAHVLAEEALRDANARLEDRVRERTAQLDEANAKYRTAEVLRESEARFRLIADTLPQIVWSTRPDGHHDYYNRRWYEFTGVPDGSTDGEAWNGMFHADDQPRAWARWRHSLATGDPYEIEYRLRHRTGEYRWTLGRALPVRDADGQITRWLGTCTDIDAMKRMTAEREHLLEREQLARGEAEAANRAKDKFLAVLSHELRTPLSPVVMIIPSMESDPDMPPKFHEDLAMVRRNIELEVKLIDDLLDLSRVTSGKLPLELQPVDVHDVLAHALRSGLSEGEGKDLIVRRQFAATHVRITADPGRLQQVFWNLLRNAAKFTPAGGTITVRTSNPTGGDARVLVEVEDSGVGIAAEVLPRIFDAFEQGDASVTRQFGGLGLGLAIARAVVEMHGGAIRAGSDGPSRGSRFTVELMTVAPEPTTVFPATNGQEAPRSDPFRARVLLVEDHPDTARTLARLLKIRGFAVRTAHTVASALEAAAGEPFDVLISDIGLPDATGYELMARIRDDYGIKGIALSGYGMEGDMQKSREAGFVDHVVKPVNVAHLEAVIRRVTATHDTPPAQAIEFNP